MTIVEYWKHTSNGGDTHHRLFKIPCEAGGRPWEHGLWMAERFLEAERKATDRNGGKNKFSVRYWAQIAFGELFNSDIQLEVVSSELKFQNTPHWYVVTGDMWLFGDSRRTYELPITIDYYRAGCSEKEGDALKSSYLVFSGTPREWVEKYGQLRSTEPPFQEVQEIESARAFEIVKGGLGRGAEYAHAREAIASLPCRGAAYVQGMACEGMVELYEDAQAESLALDIHVFNWADGPVASVDALVRAPVSASPEQMANMIARVVIEESKSNPGVDIEDLIGRLNNR